MDELYRHIVDALPGMVWVARTRPGEPGTEWLHISERMLAWLGTRRESLAANDQWLHENVHIDDRESFAAALAKAGETCAPLDWQGRCYANGREVRWIHVTARLERDQDGAITWFGETADRTEAQKAQESAQRERERNEKMIRTVFDALPFIIGVMDQEGRIILHNETAVKTLRVGPIDGIDNIAENYGSYTPDGSQMVPSEQNPLPRSLRGEVVRDFEILQKNAGTPNGILVSYSSAPLYADDGSVYAAYVIGTDITSRRALEREVEHRNAELVASEQAKTALIERLRYAIDELSTPVLEVWDDVLVTPIIGVIDSRRMADMVQKLLGEIVRTQAQHVIVDLTGVDLVDTKTADHLIKMVRKAELIGARCMLTGIQPGVAQTLVDIGVDFGRLTTLRNLKHGLRESMRRKGTGESRTHNKDEVERDRAEA